MPFCALIVRVYKCLLSRRLVPKYRRYHRPIISYPRFWCYCSIATDSIGYAQQRVFSTTRTCQRIFESQFRKALYATKTHTTNDGKVVSLALVPTVQAPIPSSCLPQLELEAKSEFHIPVVVTCQAVCGSVEPAECWSGLWLQSLNEQLAKVDVVEYVVRCGAENELLVLTPWQAKALSTVASVEK